MWHLSIRQPQQQQQHGHKSVLGCPPSRRESANATTIGKQSSQAHTQAQHNSGKAGRNDNDGPTGQKQYVASENHEPQKQQDV